MSSAAPRHLARLRLCPVQPELHAHFTVHRGGTFVSTSDRTLSLRKDGFPPVCSVSIHFTGISASLSPRSPCSSASAPSRSGAVHSSQNFAPSSFSCWRLGDFINCPKTSPNGP